MAQAKKKSATRTAKKSSAQKTTSRKHLCYQKYEKGQSCNIVFVVSMSVLATALLIADLLMMS